MAKNLIYKTSAVGFDGAALFTPTSNEMSLSSTNDSTGINQMCPWNATLQRIIAYNRGACSTSTTITLKIGNAVTASKYYFNSAFSMSSASVLQLFDSPATASGNWISMAVPAGDLLVVTATAAAGNVGGILAVGLVLNPNI